MRVTNKLLVDNFLRNLNYNLRRMKEAQYKLSSGHQIEVASDDPVGASMIMKLKSDLADLNQYKKNIEDARSWLEYTETALINIEGALERLREIVIYGANGTLSDSDRYALAEEVKELKDHIIQEANASYAGRYIFGGYKTDNPPYDSSAGYNGDNGEIKYEVSPGNRLRVNLTGDEVFNSTYNLFQVIDDIYNDLMNGDTSTLSGIRLSELDECIDNILKCRAQIGAKVKRIEDTMKAYEADEINLTKLLAQSEDADLAQVVMDLTNQENVYRAALATGARIIQPSLADFLR